MPKKEQATLEELNKVFSAQVPDGRTIAREVVDETLAAQPNAASIKKHFSEFVEKLQVEAYERYLRYEKDAWRVAFARVFGPKLRECSTPEKVLGIIGDHFYTLDKFFLSRTQSRRSRAGTAFEVVLGELFKKLGYRFDPQPEIDGNPDFVFPSINLYKRNAQDAIVFTAKRTLRERWRQIVTEGTRGLGFFLATIDENISQRDLKEMLASRIHVVVPKRIMEANEDYQNAANVMTFEDFFKHHLDPAMKRWKSSGVI